MPETPPTARLGEDDELVAIDSQDALAATSLALAAQCRQRLDIVSRHLDPGVYDTEAFAEAVKQLALGNRRARIRLLVIDSRPLVSRGHRLIELAQRLSSYIEMRSPARQHKGFNEALLVADNRGYVHRQFSDRFEGVANFNDRRAAAALSDRFDELWERGQPDPNFRRPHL